MQEFTFGMLTYNQEDYVIEHLESIKYQILNYGKNIKVYFVLSDDASKDNTVKYVKKWTEANKELFAGIKIVAKESNEGIVPNYLTMLSNIHTSHYKILAGDDMYYKNNVFELAKQGSFIITPTIYFAENRISTFITIDRYEILLLHNEKGNLKNYLRKRLRYSNCIDAPGVFLNYCLIDQELVNELKKYQWVEDVPMWSYLFNKDTVEVQILQEPYILYRSAVGISRNKNHSARKPFDDEVLKIKKTIFVDRSRYPRIINFYGCKYEWERFMLKFYWRKNNKMLKAFEKNISTEEMLAEDYLLEILDNANEWKEKYLA